MDFSEQTREASHAGSWYKDDPEELDKELQDYLDSAEKTAPEGKYLKVNYNISA